MLLKIHDVPIFSGIVGMFSCKLISSENKKFAVQTNVVVVSTLSLSANQDISVRWRWELHGAQTIAQVRIYWHLKRSVSIVIKWLVIEHSRPSFRELCTTKLSLWNTLHHIYVYNVWIRLCIRQRAFFDASVVPFLKILYFSHTIYKVVMASMHKLRNYTCFLGCLFEHKIYSTRPK